MVVGSGPGRAGPGRAASTICRGYGLITSSRKSERPSNQRGGRQAGRQGGREEGGREGGRGGREGVDQVASLARRCMQDSSAPAAYRTRLAVHAGRDLRVVLAGHPRLRLASPEVRAGLGAGAGRGRCCRALWIDGEPSLCASGL